MWCPARLGVAMLGSLVVVTVACSDGASGPNDPGDSGGPTPQPDVTAPSVQITSPAAGEDLATTNLVTVSGTASDDQGVTAVKVSVNGGPANTAQGTANWSYGVAIGAPGAVTVSVTAEDAAGNASQAVTVSFTVLPGWLQLGPDVSGVSAVAIASDGSALYRFYCVPVENRDEGKLEQWTDGAWTSVANLTNECHEPDVEVEGSLWVASFADDSPDYGFASNANGPVVVFTGVLLVHQWGMNVAIAQGRPYMAFAARYSDGDPFSYMMLHVISPIPPGPEAELNGGWGRDVGMDIATDPAITGNASGWYAVTRQGNALYVKQGFHDGFSAQYQDIGPGFTVAGDPVAPEIIMLEGAPVVAWLESGQTKIWVARFDGSEWLALGQGEVTSGLINHVRADTYESDLYVMQVNTAESPLLQVSHWNGATWDVLPDALGAGEVPSIATGDVAVQSDGPVVAYVAGGVMKVKRHFQ